MNGCLHKIASELFHGNESAFARTTQVSLTSAYKSYPPTIKVNPPGRMLGNLAKSLL